MFLHEDRSVFKEILFAASEYLGRSLEIVEKDYYVTMILKLLSEQYENVVFKGGTSLSKALHVISRFSEDIDITFSEHIGESRRKKLKNGVIADISKILGMPIPNWDKLQSDRDLNAYIFSYESVVSYNDKLISGVKLETALGSYAFPTVEMQIDSFVYQYLISIQAESLIEKYGLYPFKMHVQSLERTFIDKIFALCDYYMQGKIARLSRHLYDIYKLFPLITFDESFFILFNEVRNHRAMIDVCPSAKPDIIITEIINDICETDYYKNDYNTITTFFITDKIEYFEAKECLNKLKEILK